MLAASLVLAGAAMAAPRDVVADYADDGQISRCYPDADFTGALRIVRADQQQYGAAVDVIEAKQAECTRPGTATADVTRDDSGGGSTALWVVLVVVVVAAAGGAALVAARRRGARR